MTERSGIFERPTEELTPAEITARSEAVLDTVVEKWKREKFLRESVETHDKGWVHVLSTTCEFSGGGVGTTIATAEHESAHMVSTVVVRGGTPIPVMLQATARQFPAEGVRHTEMDRGGYGTYSAVAWPAGRGCNSSHTARQGSVRRGSK